MLMFFSRPPEVPGIFAIILTFVVCVLITMVCAVSLWIFSSSNHEKIKSYLTGLTFVGLFFLAFQIIMFIPFLIVFFFVYSDVIKPLVSPSHETFHDFNNFLTYFWLIITLVVYGLVVRFSHHKLYQRFLNWKGKFTK